MSSFDDSGHLTQILLTLFLNGFSVGRINFRHHKDTVISQLISYFQPRRLKVNSFDVIFTLLVLNEPHFNLTEHL